MRTKQDLLDALSQKGWEYRAEENYLHKESNGWEVEFDSELFSVDYGLLYFDEAILILELSEVLKRERMATN